MRSAANSMVKDTANGMVKDMAWCDASCGAGTRQGVAR